MAEKRQEKVEWVKFELSKPHKHRGKVRQPEEVLDLRRDQADRLLAEGKGRITG
ncbi:hypothetical protein H0Z60_10185 [Ectothiorhodospiraceae bacterium WFHF3C12]|nr:hypothetical protein [Ectothiorhodospiraceae bacterium WFHF3C12]